MLVGMLLTRTLGQLGKVGSKAVSCGKLVKLFLGKIRQGAVLVVMKIAVRVHNSTGFSVDALEEMERSDSSKLGEEGLKS